jgi:hypothetical protein
VLQLFTATHVLPSPEYPALQAQLFVAGPVYVQAAFTSHPPLLVAQLFTGVQVLPLPEYPALQVHELVAGPVEAQVAFESQPPFATRHSLIQAQL